MSITNVVLFLVALQRNLRMTCMKRSHGKVAKYQQCLLSEAKQHAMHEAESLQSCGALKMHSEAEHSSIAVETVKQVLRGGA